MSEKFTSENARVKSARLYLCDHGVWTSTIHLEAEGCSQGYGGYRMHEGPWMALWVRGICETLGVDDWAKVAGSYVRVRRDGPKILAIGHIVEDRWFDFDAVIKAWHEGK